MRYRDLIEAPIGNIDSIEVKPTGSFAHETDRAIISSDRARAKIRRVLARVPQTIDLVFLDTGEPVPSGFVNDYALAIGGVFPYEAIKSRYDTLPERSSEDAIMLVLTFNEGQDRKQLSPWIIAHRMGHGLVMDDDYERIFQNAEFCLRDLTSYLYDGWAIPTRATCHAIGTMKSAREGKLTQTLEFLFEMFAQTVVQGKVTFNRFTIDSFKEVIGRHYTGPFPRVEERDVEEFNRMLSSAERQITGYHFEALKKAEGHVVIL